MRADSPESIVSLSFRDRWDEPEEVFPFDASQVKTGRQPQMERLQILYWTPDDKTAVTRFLSVGMSSRAMRGGAVSRRVVLSQVRPCFH